MDGLRQWELANKALLQPKRTAWPTVGLFVTCVMIYFSSTLAGVFNYAPFFMVMFLNILAIYGLFTVVHDSSHRAICAKQTVNDLMGIIAAAFLTPLASISVFRFIHMQHHRFANDEDGRDPDAWCNGKNILFLPFRFLSLDLYYLVWYLKHWSKRSPKEHRKLVIALCTWFSVLFVLLYLGFAKNIFYYWFIPSRISVALLTLIFDYLPHYPHDVSADKNRFRHATIKPGWSFLMTPIFSYQNYHLIHHLYPLVPFYHYKKVWQKARPYLIASGARVVNWRNQEI